MKRLLERGGLADSVVSETILRNTRVLAIDQSVEEKAGQKTDIGKTATLELTPDQAGDTDAGATARHDESLELRSPCRFLQRRTRGIGNDGADKKRGPINTRCVTA